MARILTNENNLDVLYEDNHLIVINKRPGDIVQGDQTGDTPISEHVKQFLKKKYNKPGNVFAGVCHRLDRPTSGVLILAKTSKALSRMNAQFRDNKIHKTYWAITDNLPQEGSGRLVHFLKKDANRNRSKGYIKSIPGSKEATLDYAVIGKQNKKCLLELKPVTGRHHQIRVQLSSIGCPIYGDLKYGSEAKTKEGRLYLHARAVNFIHPVKKEAMEIVASTGDEKEWNNFK